jgi:glycosyltransferase involved in cell wall biosynthesis
MTLLKDLPKVTNKTGFPWTKETPISIYRKEITYPKITIITPSYNQGQFLEETIRSVLLQNYPNLEYIIIDGGSMDNSVEIIEKYKGWIDYWISEADNGQAHAINKGIEKATGTILNWLNSDDWFLPNILEIIGRTFANNKNLKCVTGLSLFIKDGKVIRPFQSTIHDTIEESIAKLNISQPSTFFTIDIFEKKILQTMHYMFDAEIWTQFLLTCQLDQLKFIELPFAYYRLHDDSKTIALKSKFQDDRRILLFALQHFCISNPKSPIPIPNNSMNVVNTILTRWKKKPIHLLDEKKLQLHIYQAYFEQAFYEGNYHIARQFAKKIWLSYLRKPKAFIRLSLMFMPIFFTDTFKRLRNYD